MDTLKIEIVNELSQESESIEYEVVGQIYINNELITNYIDYPIDLFQMHQSLIKAGNYDFWTCHCGIAACAGLSTSIEVKQESNTVIWFLADLPFLPNGSFSFDKVLYEKEIKEAILQINRIAKFNKQANIPFVIYPDPKFTRLGELLAL